MKRYRKSVTDVKVGDTVEATDDNGNVRKWRVESLMRLACGGVVVNGMTVAPPSDVVCLMLRNRGESGEVCHRYFRADLFLIVERDTPEE